MAMKKRKGVDKKYNYEKPKLTKISRVPKTVVAPIVNS